MSDIGHNAGIDLGSDMGNDGGIEVGNFFCSDDVSKFSSNF